MRFSNHGFNKPVPLGRPRPISLQRLAHMNIAKVSVGRDPPYDITPPLSSGGALVVRPWLRFHIPLIEPDVQISRIRLVLGFLCQGITPFLSSFVIPVFCSTRAAEHSSAPTA
jgi:hypothetical protein